MTHIIKRFLVAAVVIVGMATSVAAEPDTQDGVSGEEVVVLYLGKTWVWSKGGAYWGSKGAFEAVWDGSVAVGQWYATTSGKVCYEATWTWVEGASDKKECWNHVTDSEGRLWKQNTDGGEWYAAEDELKQEVKKGNKINTEVQKLRKQFGV